MLEQKSSHLEASQNFLISENRSKWLQEQNLTNSNWAYLNWVLSCERKHVSDSTRMVGLFHQLRSYFMSNYRMHCEGHK
jgi:hypothetical protein